MFCYSFCLFRSSPRRRIANLPISNPVPLPPDEAAKFNASISSPKLTPTPTVQAPQSSKRAIVSAVLKRTIVLAATIAQNVPTVPGVQQVGTCVITIIQQVDRLKLNEELSQGLANDLEGMLYSIARYAAQHPEQETIQQFVDRIQLLADENHVPKSKFMAFISAGDKYDTILKLRKKLDSAVQLLHTGLHLAVLEKLDAVKIEKWKEAVEKDPASVIQSIRNIDYVADGRINYNVQSDSNVEVTIADAKFESKQDFIKHITGSTVRDVVSDTTIRSGGDIDLITIATSRPPPQYEQLDRTSNPQSESSSAGRER